MSTVLRGTKVIQNGKKGESDLVLGWLAKVFLGVATALLVVVVQRGFHISAQIDRMADADKVRDARIASVEALATAMINNLATQLHNQATTEAAFMTRAEFLNWLNASYTGLNEDRNIRH